MVAEMYNILSWRAVEVLEKEMVLSRARARAALEPLLGLLLQHKHIQLQSAQGEREQQV